MILCEEYFKRHAIDLPLVAYRKQSCVVCDYTGLPCSFLLLYIRRAKEKNGPAPFEVSYQYPSTRLVFAEQKREVVAWDEYEQYILSLRSQYEPFPREAGLLIIWETIVRCFDDWLASNRTYFGAVDLLFQTIDPENPERLQSIHRFVNNFRQEQIGIEGNIASWWNAVNKDYSDWFVRLQNMV
jgi:hypothetical protein